ncbi:hypothetical protein TIFTF001_025547 [Ficus carica]|uniref:Uncharacterized protein n=1 Tax=Ficus carica TaxID=3494 RepID=A0AA88AYX3_FICCA|nr:hypothetical protein TIFTF001_025547 [Ficus carica]
MGREGEESPQEDDYQPLPDIWQDDNAHDPFEVHMIFASFDARDVVDYGGGGEKGEDEEECEVGRLL